MKKRFLMVFLLVAVAVMLSACGEKEKTPEADAGNAAETAEEAVPATTDTLPTVLNSSEYVLYQNIFYNGYASQYDGKAVEKTGIFTTIQDAYNDVARYYVWGNLDQTMCCDWQWELKVDDPSTLPANGSLIRVKGKFVSDDKALDGYWIVDPQIEVKSVYTGASADLDMTTMSGTLERVQVINYTVYPDKFEGKTVFAYGRIFDTVTFQDPYYDGSWTAPFSTDGGVPATGTSVVLRGVLRNAVLTDVKLEVKGS